uniref:Uncharacterized protein n=1 Tax=Anguilla anguilla TaxID=7936 RepID=A0A0E9PH94_ANGAN
MNHRPSLFKQLEFPQLSKELHIMLVIKLLLKGMKKRVIPFNYRAFGHICTTGRHFSK